MNKEIKLLTNEGRNCREDVIATAVNHIGRDFKLLFSESWGFDLLEADANSTLGDRLVVEWGDIYSLALKYCGVKIVNQQLSSAEEAYKIIQEQIKKVSVAGFTMDAHWCPWTDFFQVENVHVQGHTILGYDLINEKDILCVDCLPAHYGVTVPFEYFLKGNNGKIIVFEKDELQYSQPKLQDIVNNMLIKVRRQGAYGDTFQSIRAFSRMFPNIEYENTKPCEWQKTIW